MRRFRPHAGLTLLEVVLAVTLTVALMGSVLAFYSLAMDVRKSVSADMQAISSRRLIMDRITSELRAAVVLPFLGMGMEGEADQIRFIVAALPGPAAWAVRKTTEDPIPPEQDLRLVGYRLRTFENEQHEQVIENLERTCQKIIAVETAEEGEEIETAAIGPDIKFLYFRYWDCDAQGWTASWAGSGLPGAVEITIGAEPLPEKTDPGDYPYPVHRRVVYLPGGARAPTGTIIRGLGRGRGGR